MLGNVPNRNRRLLATKWPSAEFVHQCLETTASASRSKARSRLNSAAKAARRALGVVLWLKGVRASAANKGDIELKRAPIHALRRFVGVLRRCTSSGDRQAHKRVAAGLDQPAGIVLGESFRRPA